ncbi:MAG: putative addiction module antidote protein [Acidiferrobacterales bacterium]|nr:putative addiction module antidote protein [Acidiferrobacterales bacterium]
MNRINIEASEIGQKVSRWNPKDFLISTEASVAYLEAAFEDGDPQLIVAAIGDIAKAYSMTKLASKTRLSRESLYKALSQRGNPRFATVLNLLLALDMKLQPVSAVPDQAHLHGFVKMWDHDYPSSEGKIYLFGLQDGEAQLKGIF